MFEGTVMLQAGASQDAHLKEKCFILHIWFSIILQTLHDKEFT